MKTLFRMVCLVLLVLCSNHRIEFAGVNLVLVICKQLFN